MTVIPDCGAVKKKKLNVAHVMCHKGRGAYNAWFLQILIRIIITRLPVVDTTGQDKKLSHKAHKVKKKPAPLVTCVRNVIPI